VAGERRKNEVGARSTIRRKLVAVVLIAIATTTTLSTLASAWREANRYGEAKIAEVTGIAHVIANAVAAPLAAKDRMGVIKALRPIGRIPAFTNAAVMTEAGTPYADLGLSVTLREDPDRWILLRSNIEVDVPVMSSGAQIGSLRVLVNTSDLRQRLIDGALTGLLAALFAAGLGVAIATRLQRRITAPLAHLTERMFDVQRTSDFNARVDVRSNDETGVLVEAFNGMLEEIRQRDDRLSEHRENLENTVEERTQHLRVAKEEAEDANAAKSEFLATMSHEIRTPMNGMLVMAELLASANLSDRHRRYSDVIVKSGQSLLTIINDILDFSKIESGKLDLEVIALDPSEVVDDVLALFWERAVGKGLDLTAHVATDVPAKIEGDPVRLNQVLSNLVNNALKFTEDGHVDVLVESAPGGLRFSVADTGIGIPADKIPTIFESFSQADQSTTRRFGGTGLGLAICRRLVDAMGGEIGATSEPGQGSRFSFTISAAPVVGEARDHGAASALRHAAVAHSSAATADAISRYLADRGVACERIGPHEISSWVAVGAGVVFAESAAIADLAASEQEAVEPPYIVCVSQMGDSRSDEVIASGQAHELIMRPVSRNGIGDLLVRLEAGEPRGRAALEARQGAELPRFSGLRVLVADDSPVNREVVIEALKQLDVAADVVEDGPCAVEAAGRETYDLIFMDCSMPGMDGFEATRAIRTQESERGQAPVPVVALTAHVAGGVADAWRDAGMNDYMTKPFRITDLAECFETFCGAPAQSGGAPAPAAEPAQNAPVPAEEDAETTEQGEEPVIDDTVLDKALTGDTAANAKVIVRVLGLFESHAPPALLKLAEAARDDAGEEIAKAAHALKSMSANIGAVRLARACGALEADAKVGKLDDLVRRLAGLQQLLVDVLAHIEARKSGLGEGAAPAVRQAGA
jgi:two-component system sensor histidine kinase BarA